MNITKINTMVTQIMNEPSKNLKKDLIKQVYTDELGVFLRFLFDISIKTGISTKNIKKNLDKEQFKEIAPTIENFKDFISYFSKNKSGRDVDIFVAQDYISRQADEDKEFATKVVTQSLKLGVTAKTINEAVGSIVIPVFAVQLANTLTDTSKINSRIAASLKLDGHRHLAEVKLTENGPEVRYFTRKGHLVEGLKEMEKALTHAIDWESAVLSYENGFILDGEAVIAKTDSPIEKLYNETSSIIRSKGEKANLKHKIFDVIDIDEFYSGQSSDNYFERRKNLENIIQDNEFVEKVEVLYQSEDIPTEEDFAKINEIYEKLIEEGQEGLMINTDTPYFCKRNNGLLKVKPTVTADLEIIGFEKGEDFSKYENTLGKLIVDYKGNPVGVGSGLTDAIREAIWQDKEAYLGKIVEIAYTVESTNQNDDGISLRFPRFKRFRPDKTKEDVSYQ